jgi:hypothetical protein
MRGFNFVLIRSDPYVSESALTNNGKPVMIWRSLIYGELKGRYL